ncbi:serine hydrolase domain-containing protein [Amycolatopsis nigrescens]|uniref:serine hydrolase domain-containing protein n=1 Tax=Amycolatopsis nigrescens TaxID=381445 RepID=UPI0003704EAF|nr:serine hydrolase domain-containing protein [Amycolatopsis nigrescens]
MRIEGMVRRGFESVRAVFEEIVAASAGGAAFSVVRRGETLVNLWGGHADPTTGRAWAADTVVVLFSGTKGLAATVLADLADRGVLAPEDRVARHWPEFAAGGKQDVRVHHLLAHTAGLPYVDPVQDDLLDNRANAAALARQTPLWTPGERVAYHAVTFGYLLTELVRRCTGKRVGELVAERFTGPHALDVHLGTPERVRPRLARIVREPGYRISTFLRDDPARRAIVDRMYRGLLGDGDLVNDPRYHRAELSAGSAVGGSLSMARFYDLLATGGLVGEAALATATSTWAQGPDVINDRPLHFGLGYELADPIGTYGPAEVAFGHSGAGGGRHGALPEAELGFSFTTNEMCSEDTDTRATRLLTALPRS